MSVTQLSKDAAWQTRSWTRYVRNGALCFCSNLLGLIIRSAPMPFQLGWTLLEKLMDRCCRLQPPVALKSSRKLAIFSTAKSRCDEVQKRQKTCEWLGQRVMGGGVAKINVSDL